MLDRKKYVSKTLVISIIAFGLCLSTIGINAINTQNKSSDLDYDTPWCTFKKIETLQAQSLTNSIKKFDVAGMTGSDTLIYGGGEMICQNPSITDNLAQGILLGFELWPDWVTPPDPYFRFSTDGGMTWLPEDSASGWNLAENGYDSILPVVDFAGDKGGFGSILPSFQNNWVTFNFPDITDPDAGDEWLANSWIADVMMTEWHSVDVCGVNSEYAPSEDSYGLAVWTGDTVDGVTNGMWFGWEVSEGTEFTVYSDENSGVDFDVDQATNDVDLSTGMYYQAFLHFNDVSSDPLPDGVSLRGVQLDGTDQWLDSWNSLAHIQDATNPDVKADSGNCYLVYEVNGNIGCHYSNDNGISFQNVVIAEDGKFPTVSAIDETVFVSYIRNGNVYNSISEDGGATWVESAVHVNDVEGNSEEQFHGVDVSSNFISWTDNRNGENSVYFDLAEVALPIIEVESVTGGMGIKAVIKNSGSADATNIDWSIRLSGRVFIGEETTGTITNLAQGETIEIESGFVFGLGATEITIEAGGAKQELSGSILLFFVLGI
jgi:hypothetical protein